MFAKNKVSQSLVDAVNKIMSEKEVESKEELLNEAEKVPTATGMKVYGSRYGDSQKARKDQLKTSLDDVKGPSEKDGKLSGGGLYLSKNVKEELKGNQHKIDKNKNNKIDAQDFKMLRKEELKGDQHKIDANKNNKIDAHDFQLLRGKKKVKEDTFAAKLLNSLVESEEIQKEINEVMKKDATAGDWIHDFVHSKNPKFAGKSTKERQKMALGAYYAKQNEAVEELEQAEALVENFNIINEVSVGAKIRAYAQHTTDSFEHGDMGNDDESEHHHERASKIMAHIEKHHGPEAAKHAEKLANSMIFGRHDIGSKTSPGEDSLHGGLRRNLNKSVTKSGKIGKSTQKAMKGSYMAKRTITGPKAQLPESFELNEISKSEVDHHYDKWTSSSDAPNHHDAGDDPKIHKSALKYLRGTNEPKENHEKIAMHIANKFHGSGIDEAAPKKMDDVAKQNLTPAKKGVVGTVKSDFKNFKNFLAGKPETNEAVESLDEDRYLMKYLLSRGINPKYVDRNTRVGHAKSNEFKKWKADHLNSLIVTRESNEMPFDGPYTKTKKNVKDKSGAVHTPMSRARNLARAALKSVQDKTKIK
jgi:hypothetical protein